MKCVGYIWGLHTFYFNNLVKNVIILESLLLKGCVTELKVSLMMTYYLKKVPWEKECVSC